MPKGYPGTKAPHGTITRYTRHACRCEECRQAMRDYHGTKQTRAEYEASRKAAADARHGYERSYIRGCRCEECKRAATAARRERRHKDPERTRAYDRDYQRKRRAAA